MRRHRLSIALCVSLFATGPVLAQDEKPAETSADNKKPQSWLEAFGFGEFSFVKEDGTLERPQNMAQAANIQELYVLFQLEVLDELEVDEVQKQLLVEAIEEFKAGRQRTIKERPIKQEDDEEKYTPYELKYVQQQRRRVVNHYIGVEARDALRLVLDEEQQKRLGQIVLLWRFKTQGLKQMARDQYIVANLRLSAEQRETLKKLKSTLPAPPPMTLKNMGNTAGEHYEYMAASRVDINNQAVELLTEKQRAKWREMLGQPFHHPEWFTLYDRKSKELEEAKGKQPKRDGDPPGAAAVDGKS